MTDDDQGVSDPGFEVLSRTPMSGGFSDASKFRLQVVQTAHGERVERTLLLKQTSRIEVDALTAAAQVPGAGAVPEVVDTGDNADGPFIVTRFYDAQPARDEKTLPPNVIETLARVHAYYLTEPVPPNLPVVDAPWWRAKCDVSMQRLHALGRPVARSLAAQVKTFRNDAKMIKELDETPRTLIHGDVHHNNVLVDSDGLGHLIDWGGSFVGAPALDLHGLGGEGGWGLPIYLDAWNALTGQRLDADPDWRRSLLVATVWSNIKYVAFATRMFGDRVGESMITKAVAARQRL